MGTSGHEETSQRVALLDTSVQVDRVKTAARKRHADNLLAQFDLTVATGISLLEFKATIVQECITIHNALRRDGRFTAVRDSLVESLHPQHRLRAHIFNNLLTTFAASSFEVSDEDDRRLADKARLHLEGQIPKLYQWFCRKSVDAILDESIRCTRAEEPPSKKKAAYAANLPICKRGKNKRCHVEEFIRLHGVELVSALRTSGHTSDQLERTCALFDRVRDDPQADLSHSQCRSAGDCLIALEGQDHATHAVSTNAAEWEPISKLLGYEFVKVEYSDERRK